MTNADWDMALSSYPLPTIPSSFCFLCLFHFNKSNNGFHLHTKIYKGFSGMTPPSSSGGMRGGNGLFIGSLPRQAADFLITPHSSSNWRMNAVGIDSTTSSHTRNPTIHDKGPNGAAATLEIHVTCYQVILYYPSLFSFWLRISLIILHWWFATVFEVY